MNQSSDDAEELVGTGVMYLDSSDLELINDDDYVGGDQVVGIRFRDIIIPPGATIQNAYIEFETDEISSGITELTIFGQAADNPETFTGSIYNISSRPHTSASVAWSPTEWNTEDEKHQTSDLSTVIQEIVNRSGWSSGNAIVFIIEGSGTRIAESYNGELENAPLLAIDYTLTTNPTIFTLGTLSDFSSEPGEYSTEQSYSISGSNLSADISITPPMDFEISLTSGANFISNPNSITLTPDDGSVPSTMVYVRFKRANSGTSEGNIIHASSGAPEKNMAVRGTAYDASNQSPYPPVLVQPTDNATEIIVSPTLEITVSDPEEDTMEVTFYGRPRDDDFTLFVYPDTQSATDVSHPYPEVFYSMSNYIVEKETEFNVVFATHVGDIVENADQTSEWKIADTAMDILDTAGIPYSVGPGNHDTGLYTSGVTYYSDYFGSSRFSDKPWYEGYYNTDNFNNYSMFSAAGMDFIIINLQYDSTADHLDWADALLKANPNRRGIVAQHDILNVDNSFQNNDPYISLKDNPNLFLMLCGHEHALDDGSAYRAEPGDNGQTIHILLTDYQDYEDGGGGYLRNLRFSPSDDKIYASIYSPYLDASLTDAENYEEFVMDYTMTGGVSFEIISTVSNVSSGEIASITWPGLDTETNYEWYVVVDDGNSTTTSSTWSFTTGDLANRAPVITESDPQEETMSEDGSPNDFGLTLNATDEDGDTLTWSISIQASHGTATASGTGYSKEISYKPIDNYNGTDSFEVQVSDGNGATDTITVDVDIEAVNDAPQVTDIPDQMIDEGESFATIDLDEYVSDIDNTDAEMNWTYSGNTELVIAISDRKATISTPDAEWNGSETITFKAADLDGLYDEDNATFTVTEVNRAPVITESDPQEETMSEDGSPNDFSLTLNATDEDGDTLTWSISTQANHGTATASGTGYSKEIGYVPEDNYNGTDSFEVQVSDGNGTTDTITVDVEIEAVNDAPQVTDIPDQTIAEGGSFVTISLDEYVSDIDNTDEEMDWTYSGNAELIVVINNRVATISTPSAGWNGSETITFKAADPDGLNDEDSATFTVTEVNSAPEVDDIPDQTIAEGGSFVTISLDEYVSDIDNTDEEMDWTYSGDTELIIAINNRVATISTPSAEWNGSETITFKAADPDGLNDEDSVTFTVTEVNSAPEVDDIPDQMIDEGESFATISLDEYVSDVDNTDAEMTWTYSGNTELIIAINNRVATISTPSAGWNGSETITFKAADLDGLYDEDSATFTVTEEFTGNITYLGNIGSANNKTTNSNQVSGNDSSVLVITIHQEVASGDSIIVAFVSNDDSDYTISVNDSAGNTYTEAVSATSYEHGHMYIFFATAINTLPNGGTIAITHTALSSTTVAVACAFSGLSDDPLDQSLGNPLTGSLENISGTEPTVGPTDLTEHSYELLIGSIGTEGPVEDEAGIWLNEFMAGPRVGTTGGKAMDNRTISLGYKIISEKGTYTAAKSGITDRYWVAALATFKGVSTKPLIQYVIRSIVGANGNITPTGEVLVTEGSDQGFTITPNNGYQVADVLVDGVSVGAVTSFTFTNVQADHSIIVSFEEISENYTAYIPFIIKTP